MDFVNAQLATGRKIRVLTIVDTFLRYAPALDPRFSYRGEGGVDARKGLVMYFVAAVPRLGLRFIPDGINSG